MLIDSERASRCSRRVNDVTAKGERADAAATATRALKINARDHGILIGISWTLVKSIMLLHPHPYPRLPAPASSAARLSLSCPFPPLQLHESLSTLSAPAALPPCQPNQTPSFWVHPIYVDFWKSMHALGEGSQNSSNIFSHSSCFSFKRPFPQEGINSLTYQLQWHCMLKNSWPRQGPA